MVRQTWINRVDVSWDDSDPLPINGYRITTNSTDISRGIDVISSPRFTTALLGVNHFRLVALSRHLPSTIVGPVEVVVRGKIFNPLQ